MNEEFRVPAPPPRPPGRRPAGRAHRARGRDRVVASAHVTVSSPDAAAGGYGKLTFRVPNESDAASTVGLRIQFPDDTPRWPRCGRSRCRAGRRRDHAHRARPAGHRRRRRRRSPKRSRSSSSAPPRASGSGRGSSRSSRCPGGPFPDAESLTFPVVQVYSDGTEAAWIEPTRRRPGRAGAPGPRAVARRRARPRTPPAPRPTTPPTTHDEATDVLARRRSALFLSILALLVGDRRRRPRRGGPPDVPCPREFRRPAAVCARPWRHCSSPPAWRWRRAGRRPPRARAGTTTRRRPGRPRSRGRRTSTPASTSPSPTAGPPSR